MKTLKIIGLVLSLALFGGVAFCTIWTIQNWSKVQDITSGSNIYNKTDLDNAYKDGYNTALTNEEEYNALLDTYRDSITNLEDSISQMTLEIIALTGENTTKAQQITVLTNQKDSLTATVQSLNSTIESNNSVIASLNADKNTLQNQVNILTSSGNDNTQQITILNNQIASLQSSIAGLQSTNSANLTTISSLNGQISSLTTQVNNLMLQSNQNNITLTALNSQISALQYDLNYYQQLLSAYQNDERFIVSFVFNGSVYNVQVVNPNSIVSVVIPTSTEYAIFNGWTVDGSNLVNVAEYPITANTTFTALITQKYDVNFIYENNLFNTQIVENGFMPTYPLPSDTTYKQFLGWSLDGNTVIDITNTPINHNTTYFAVVRYSYDITFAVDGETYDTQIVATNNFATTPTAPVKENHNFMGWSIDGETVINIASYPITAETTFIVIWEEVLTLQTYTLSQYNVGAFKLGAEDVFVKVANGKIVSYDFNFSLLFVAEWNLFDATPVGTNITEDITVRFIGWFSLMTEEWTMIEYNFHYDLETETFVGTRYRYYCDENGNFDREFNAILPIYQTAIT